MARIAGINIPDNKHAEVSLTYIFGVGRSSARRMCDAVGVNPEQSGSANSPRTISTGCARRWPS